MNADNSAVKVSPEPRRLLLVSVVRRRRRRRRQQLVLLLGSISSVPSTAATNLSSALFCNGKSKADWGLTAGPGR